GDVFAVGPALDAVQSQLYRIDSVLDLAANFFDGFVAAFHQPSDGCGGCSDPRRVPIGKALATGNVGSRGGNTWSLEQLGIDGVADGTAYHAGIARGAD